MVYLLTILSTSRAPSLLLSFIWVHRISSLTSRGSTLLEALFTLTWLHTCPSVSPSNAGCLWIPADGFTHSERFQFDQSTDETFLLRKKEKAETIWTIDQEAQSTSFCFLVSSPRSSPQRRATLQQAILGFYEKRSAVTVQGWAGLSYSNTPELLSLSLLTYLRRCECPTKFYPTQHCNSLFWLYIQCMCACGYNITYIYTHTYMYGVFL